MSARKNSPSSSGFHDFVNQTLASEEAYKISARGYIREIESSNSEKIKTIVKSIADVLASKKETPLTKLNALKFLRDSVHSGNQLYLELIQLDVLKVMTEFAKFKSGVQDDDRGKEFFSKDKNEKELQKIGNHFLRLNLECISVWAEDFPTDISNGGPSGFFSAYNSLKKLKVKFPERMFFFERVRDSNVQKEEKEINMNGLIHKIELDLKTLKDIKDECHKLCYGEVQKNQKSFIKLSPEYQAFYNNAKGYVEQLIKNGVSKNDKYVTKLLEEQEFSSNSWILFTEWREKDITFTAFIEKYTKLYKEDKMKRTPFEFATLIENPKVEVGEEKTKLKAEILTPPGSLPYYEEINGKSKDQSNYLRVEDNDEPSSIRDKTYSPYTDRYQNSKESTIEKLPQQSKILNTPSRLDEDQNMKNSSYIRESAGKRPISSVSFKQMFEEDRAWKMAKDASQIERDPAVRNFPLIQGRSESLGSRLLHGRQNVEEQTNPFHDHTLLEENKRLNHIITKFEQQVKDLVSENESLREECNRLIRDKKIRELSSERINVMTKIQAENKELKDKLEENVKVIDYFRQENFLLERRLKDKQNDYVHFDSSPAESKNKPLFENFVVPETKALPKGLSNNSMLEYNRNDSSVMKSETKDFIGFPRTNIPEYKLSQILMANKSNSQGKLLSSSDSKFYNQREEKKSNFVPRTEAPLFLGSYRSSLGTNRSADFGESNIGIIRQTDTIKEDLTYSDTDFSNNNLLTRFSSKPHMQTQEEKRNSPLKSKEEKEFNSPYNNKSPRTKLKFKILLFEEIARTSVDLDSFKLACLKPKAALYENNFIQAGTLSGLIQQDSNVYLQISLFIGNKTLALVTDFSIKYAGNNDMTIWTKPQLLPSQIYPKCQLKQDIIIDITNIPYSFLIVELEMWQGANNIRVSVPLPVSINKFMTFQFMDLKSFESKWSYSYNEKLRSDSFMLNTNIVKSAYDFKRIIGNVIELNPEKEYDFIAGTGNFKLGVVFSIPSVEHKFYLKIILTPHKMFSLKLACDKSNLYLGEYALQTFIFLFRKD